VKFTKKQIRQILDEGTLSEVVGRHDKCPSGQKKNRITHGVYECIPDPEAAATHGAHFKAKTKEDQKQKALKYCVSTGPARYAQNWAKSLNTRTSDGETLYKCIKGRKVDKPTPAAKSPTASSVESKSGERCLWYSKKRKNWFMRKKCRADDTGPMPYDKAREELHWKRATEPTGQAAKGQTPTPAPGGKLRRGRRRAQRRRAPRRNRRSGVYAKGPEVGQIQQLLLKAFGAGFVQETKELNEVDTSPTVKPLQGGALSAKEVLGGKGRVDSMLGKTTLKSINKIPAVAKYFADMGGLSRKNVKRSVTGILNILQQCDKGGFKDWKCTPGSTEPAAAPTPTPATPAPAAAPAAAPAPTDRVVPMKTPAKKSQRKLDMRKKIASASSVEEIKSICNELNVGYTRPDLMNHSTRKKNPYGACKGYAVKPGAFNESKSPLKQKEIKHFGARRSKLLETLIKKVSK